MTMSNENIRSFAAELAKYTYSYAMENYGTLAEFARTCADPNINADKASNYFSAFMDNQKSKLLNLDAVLALFFTTGSALSVNGELFEDRDELVSYMHELLVKDFEDSGMTYRAYASKHDVSVRRVHENMNGNTTSLSIIRLFDDIFGLDYAIQEGNDK